VLFLPLPYANTEKEKKKEKNTKGQGITEARNLNLKLLEEIN
jgi:hypothetical protein